ncbi:hypothetical protein [Nonomuraea sp. NPDC050786]|uniref:hypothetical protein n=1 Tax=Nonomuraea sp. NPDC050786 TaxID=3154840 RepID=UPI0033D58CA2
MPKIAPRPRSPPTPNAERRKESADETRAVAKTTIHQLLSRRDIPLREKTWWRMLYETAARAAEILALNAVGRASWTCVDPGGRPPGSTAWVRVSRGRRAAAAGGGLRAAR